MLLWHGSRMANFGSILQYGLQIAPSDIPKSGYLFGKGAYFTDAVAKASMYCHHQYTQNVGIIALCEVALGKVYDVAKPLYNAESIIDLKKYQSLRAQGIF